jgi:YebC/PmpR family DNA-binding regulatory protein
MAGHSKWKNIKHKKAASDAKKAKVYTKIIKEITVSARTGGGDPAKNPTLRTLLEKARAANMPLENAQRAIKRGTGELPGVNYEAHQYEGYGPNGIAIIVDVLTDNKNRAVAEVRSIFTRQGGSLAENGAVSWMFERLGVICAQNAKATEESILESLIDYEITNITQSDDTWTITCDVQALNEVKTALNDLNFTIESAEPEWVAKTPMDLEEDKQEAAIDFLHAVEELDDVQNVYTNLA